MGEVFVGAEIAVAYMLSWLLAKARRAGKRADGHVDAAIDAGVDRLGRSLHELISGKLRGDLALEQLEREAKSDAQRPTERARHGYMSELYFGRG